MRRGSAPPPAPSVIIGDYQGGGDLSVVTTNIYYEERERARGQRQAALYMAVGTGFAIVLPMFLSSSSHPSLFWGALMACFASLIWVVLAYREERRVDGLLAANATSTAALAGSSGATWIQPGATTSSSFVAGLKTTIWLTAAGTAAGMIGGSVPRPDGPIHPPKPHEKQAAPSTEPSPVQAPDAAALSNSIEAADASASSANAEETAPSTATDTPSGSREVTNPRPSHQGAAPKTADASYNATTPDAAIATPVAAPPAAGERAQPTSASNDASTAPDAAIATPVAAPPAVDKRAQPDSPATQLVLERAYEDGSPRFCDIEDVAEVPRNRARALQKFLETGSDLFAMAGNGVWSNATNTRVVPELCFEKASARVEVTLHVRKSGSIESARVACLDCAVPPLPAGADLLNKRRSGLECLLNDLKCVRFQPSKEPVQLKLTHSFAAKR